MCGFVGTLQWDRSRPIDEHRLQRQLETLRNRGPDGGGLYFGPGVGFGHRRLSVLDLSGGGQPMVDPTGRYVILYNGEIYNEPELRRTLAAEGYTFRTTCDTETLLYALIHWDSACIARLNGMFAFAFYDCREHRLLLARDQMGEKPLFYYQDRERILFASEPKALLEDPTVPRDLNGASVLSYFQMAYVPGPESLFQGIRKLPPAGILEAQSGSIEQRRYWTPKPVGTTEPAKSEASQVEALRDLLDDAVRIRLRADVPVGVFLSGGIDSAAIVASASRYVKEPLRTHTIRFHDPQLDEGMRAESVAQHFGTDHQSEYLPDPTLETLEALARVYDEPFADASMIPTYALSAHTRTRVVVALSGDGGDELFAGYHHYVENLWTDSLRHRLPLFASPVWLKSALEAVHRESDRFGKYSRTVRLLCRVGMSPKQAVMSNHIGEPWRGVRLLRPDFVSSLPSPKSADAGVWRDDLDLLTSMRLFDMQTYLPDDILVKVDRASMAHGLELRSPFLDPRIVAWSLSMPSSAHLERDNKKRLLKAALRGRIPDSVLSAPKRGFRTPIDQWMRGPLKSAFESRILSHPSPGYGLIKPKILRRAWKAHLSGQRDFGNLLFLLLMFQLCIERLFGPRFSAPETPFEAADVHILRAPDHGFGP
jgi:asparagine synthase (glutamine-hydrolysing)